ncbi:MAG TPA: hypothetical protein VGO04_24725 [Ensifer sp.]|jgi:fluoride ion exporter CrcB/FEX|uniref:hypothetical protein n=1 Tax=Ensifer sp. TaxID=1872086 RepID=UPI002E159805|nr:hypothetical protein [Ensifer sp.]
MFTAGYALNAGHTVLALRYGAITASLLIAAALLIGALASGTAAIVISRRSTNAQTPISKHSSPFSTFPVRPPYSKDVIIALASGLLGALSTASVLIMFPELRNLLRGEGFAQSEPQGAVPNGRKRR